MAFDVNRLANGKACFEIFGECAAGSESTDQLAPRLRAGVRAALIGHNGRHDIAKPLGDAKTPVDVRQDLQIGGQADPRLAGDAILGQARPSPMSTTFRGYLSDIGRRGRRRVHGNRD
jgi:hypothetical protein